MPINWIPGYKKKLGTKKIKKKKKNTDGVQAAGRPGPECGGDGMVVPSPHHESVTSPVLTSGPAPRLLPALSTAEEQGPLPFEFTMEDKGVRRAGGKKKYN